MKNRILTFVIGVLVGAIITTLGIYIYSKNNTNISNMPNEGKPPTMQSEDGKMPPEKPDENENQSNETPPEKPSNSTSQNNS